MASTITQPSLDLLQSFHSNAKKGKAIYDAIAATIVDIEALQAADSALDWKGSVLAATTTALAANTRTSNTLLADANGALGTIDGVTLAVGSRLLVKNEATGANNGIYVIDSLGAVGAKWQMTRATDADSSADVTPNLAVLVERGSSNGDKIFYLDVDAAITLNTTALTFLDWRGLAITAPADVTKAAAAVGTSTTLARSDHKHDVSTAIVGAIAVGDSAAEGSATSLARSDHVHSLAAPAAPADVTKAAANAGAATTVARSDHKHDISTAVASGLTSASTSAEGSATSLARSDHAHAITALNIASAGTAAAKSAGVLAATDFAIPTVLMLTIPAGVTGDVDFTGAPYAFRVIDVYARKVITSADAGDTGALQTGAGAAISSTLALNISGGALARTTSIDPATHEIAAAGTLRWRRTQSTNADCVAYVTLVRIP